MTTQFSRIQFNLTISIQLLSQVKKEEKLQRTRDLKTIEIYRERNKKDGILNMLQSVITTEHTVHPSFGHAQFFEFVLKNPYNIQHTISIQWEDPDLR